MLKHLQVHKAVRDAMNESYMRSGKYFLRAGEGQYEKSKREKSVSRRDVLQIGFQRVVAIEGNRLPRPLLERLKD